MESCVASYAEMITPNGWLQRQEFWESVFDETNRLHSQCRDRFNSVYTPDAKAPEG